MAKNAVAKKSSTAVADGAAFSEFAGAGLENVEASDLLIPRLAILQALSPQCNPNKPEHIEGATPGQICDVGLGELLTSPALFLPVHFSKVWIEWAPRNTGKGLVAIHPDNSVLADCKPDDKGKPIVQVGDRKGNYVAETAQFFGFNLSSNSQMCFIPMTSSQLKNSRKLNTLASSEKAVDSNGNEFTPPLFYRTYELSVAAESNNDGDWFGWKVDRGPLLQELDGWEAMLERAVKFRDQIKSGEATADVGSMDEASGGNNDPDGAM